MTPLLLLVAGLFRVCPDERSESGDNDAESLKRFVGHQQVVASDDRRDPTMRRLAP